MKTVTIKYDMWWEAKLYIEESAEAAMEECLNFWAFAPGDDPRDRFDGDIEAAFLLFLGMELIHLSMSHGLEHLIKEFKDKEGFPSLDGKHGITLKSIDQFEFERDDFDIEIPAEILP